MNFLSNILGAVVSKGTGRVVEQLAGGAADVADIFTTSDRERQSQYEAETERLEVVNRREVAFARHASLFVAGSMPFMRWILGIALIYHLLIYRIAAPFLAHHTGIDLIPIDWQELMAIMSGLGIVAAQRTFEKTRGVARNSMRD